MQPRKTPAELQQVLLAQLNHLITQFEQGADVTVSSLIFCTHEGKRHCTLLAAPRPKVVTAPMFIPPFGGN